MEDGFEEVAGFGLGGGELGFYLVAEGHEFIHFGDDAVLFGEGWEGKRYPAKIPQPNSSERHPMVMSCGKLLSRW
jgi:hypothetical protein